MTHPKDYEGIAIPRPGVRRKAKLSGPLVPEAEIQAAAEMYCGLIGVEWFHLPAQMLNAAFRYRSMGGAELWAARQASARIKGFPDLILFYKGFYKAVELKSRAGVVRASQWKWLKRLDGTTCRSFDDFKSMADTWKFRCDWIDKQLTKETA